MKNKTGKAHDIFVLCWGYDGELVKCEVKMDESKQLYFLKPEKQLVENIKIYKEFESEKSSWDLFKDDEDTGLESTQPT